MKVLIIGSGGREHSLGWKISQSNKLSKLFFAPGNVGTAQIGTNIPIDPMDFEEIKTFAIEVEVDLIIVGPEQPLVEGIYDFIKGDPLLKNVNIIAPSKVAAQLEGSKKFAKEFMARHNIPTAAYQTFDKVSFNGACKFIDELKPPYVIKVDGLAAGKGVLILDMPEDAKNEIKAILFEEKFGNAGKKIIIEEFLDGIELSVFILTDGKDYIILPEAKDYKRIGEGDTGLNTGGMGSISPVPFVTHKFMTKVEDKIIKPTVKGIHQEGMKYFGFIFFGLMNVHGEPYVIEYNVRLGDPETQSVIPRIKNDLLKALLLTSQGKTAEANIRFDSRSVATIVMASKGYPEKYEVGKPITGLDSDISENTLIFHAGTKRNEKEEIVSNGGRVMAISSYGKHLIDAVAISYKAAKKIKFDGVVYRKDIGKDLLSKY